MKIIDIYTERVPKWMKEYSLEKQENQYGTFYKTKLTNKQAAKLERQLTRRKIRFRSYDENLERSSNYRSVFFHNNKPPYRCRYCHKKITGKELEVDHIIPVSKAKKDVKVRTLMLVTGIHNINDPKNLAPSCISCNRRKSDNTGLWYVRGILGKYNLYWTFIKIFKLAFIGILLFLIWYYGRMVLA